MYVETCVVKTARNALIVLLGSTAEKYLLPLVVHHHVVTLVVHHHLGRQTTDIVVTVKIGSGNYTSRL